MKSFKVTFLGEAGVGKSSIVTRFVRDHFSEYHDSTIGAAFFSKSVNVTGQNIRLDIWDTAGQERYHSLAPMYYRDTHAVVLVYDLTDYDSYKKALTWLKELQSFSKICPDRGYPLIYFAGNKLDLVANNIASRKVSHEILEESAKTNQLILFEVSAKTGHNIIELFHDIGYRLKELSLIHPIENRPLYMVLNNKEEKNNQQERDKICCW